MTFEHMVNVDEGHSLYGTHPDSPSHEWMQLPGPCAGWAVVVVQRIEAPRWRMSLPALGGWLQVLMAVLLDDSLAVGVQDAGRILCLLVSLPRCELTIQRFGLAAVKLREALAAAGSTSSSLTRRRDASGQSWSRPWLSGPAGGVGLAFGLLQTRIPYRLHGRQPTIRVRAPILQWSGLVVHGAMRVSAMTSRSWCCRDLPADPVLVHLSGPTGDRIPEAAPSHAALLRRRHGIIGRRGLGDGGAGAVGGAVSDGGGGAAGSAAGAVRRSG